MSGELKTFTDLLEEYLHLREVHYIGTPNLEAYEAQQARLFELRCLMDTLFSACRT
jgi:hypothetical protein